MNIDEIQKLDWVSFMCNGQILVGVVMYTREDKFGDNHQIYTTAGLVNIKAVLELRRNSR